MITGFAKKITLVCGNHEHPVEMSVKETETDAFWACPKYYPDNREEFESPCMNRISIYEYEKMLNKLMDLVQEDEEDGGEVYLKNRKIETPTARYKVIEEKDGMLTISVLAKNMNSIQHSTDTFRI